MRSGVLIWGLLGIIALLAIPAAYAGIAPATNNAAYPQVRAGYWALSNSGTKNFTTLVLDENFNSGVAGVWTDPSRVEAGIDLVPFSAYFNWSDMTLGAYKIYVCTEYCSVCGGNLCGCVDDCSRTNINNPPRIGVVVSAENQTNNFTISIENPTAGSITVLTNATLYIAGQFLEEHDLGSVDVPQHSTLIYELGVLPGAYTLVTNATYYNTADSSTIYYSGNETSAAIGSPTTSISMDTSSSIELGETANISITVSNPTYFNFTTNVSTEALLGGQSAWSSSTEVYLEPFTEQNVSFSFTPSAAGVYAINANTAYNSTSKDISVNALPPPPAPVPAPNNNGGGGGGPPTTFATATEIAAPEPEVLAAPLVESEPSRQRADYNLCEGPTDWSASCESGVRTRTAYRYYGSTGQCAPVIEEQECSFMESLASSFSKGGNNSPQGQLVAVTFAGLSSFAALIGTKKFLILKGF